MVPNAGIKLYFCMLNAAVLKNTNSEINSFNHNVSGAFIYIHRIEIQDSSRIISKLELGLTR